MQFLESLMEEPEDREPSAEQLVVERLLGEVLSERELEFYYLRYGEGMSFRKIAAKFGYRSTTVVQQLDKSIQRKIKHALSKEEEE